MKYESTFNAIDKILRNEAGCSNELDYIEQTSWLLFLKYLDDLESELEINAQFDGKTYKRIVTGFNRWGSWAAPKTAKNENHIHLQNLVLYADISHVPAMATVEFPRTRLLSNSPNVARSNSAPHGMRNSNSVTSSYPLTNSSRDSSVASLHSLTMRTT